MGTPQHPFGAPPSPPRTATGPSWPGLSPANERKTNRSTPASSAARISAALPSRSTAWKDRSAAPAIIRLIALAVVTTVVTPVSARRGSPGPSGRRARRRPRGPRARCRPRRPHQRPEGDAALGQPSGDPAAQLAGTADEQQRAHPVAPWRSAASSLDGRAALLDGLHVEPHPGDRAVVAEPEQDDAALVEPSRPCGWPRQSHSDQAVSPSFMLREHLGVHVGHAREQGAPVLRTWSRPPKPRLGWAGCSLRYSGANSADHGTPGRGRSWRRAGGRWCRACPASLDRTRLSQALARPSVQGRPTRRPRSGIDVLHPGDGGSPDPQSGPERPYSSPSLPPGRAVDLRGTHVPKSQRRLGAVLLVGGLLLASAGCAAKEPEANATTPTSTRPTTATTTTPTPTPEPEPIVWPLTGVESGHGRRPPGARGEDRELGRRPPADRAERRRRGLGGGRRGRHHPLRRRLPLDGAAGDRAGALGPADGPGDRRAAARPVRVLRRAAAVRRRRRRRRPPGASARTPAPPASTGTPRRARRTTSTPTRAPSSPRPTPRTWRRRREQFVYRRRRASSRPPSRPARPTAVVR